MKQGTLCWRFRVAGADKVAALGRAFASAVHLDKRPDDLPYDVLRVGLKARSGTGKSTFAEGLMSAFARQVIETHRSAGRTQSLFKTEEAGYIRHYDTLVTSLLPSRAYHTLEVNGWPGVDIVEHPERDYWPYKADDVNAIGKFDYIIALRGHFESIDRVITVKCRQQAAGSAGFREFLHDAAAIAPARELSDFGARTTNRLLR